MDDHNNPNNLAINDPVQPSSKNLLFRILLGIFLIGLIGLGYWYWQRWQVTPETAPTREAESTASTTVAAPPPAPTTVAPADPETEYQQLKQQHDLMQAQLQDTQQLSAIKEQQIREMEAQLRAQS